MKRKNVWLGKNWHKSIRQVVLYSALWLVKEKRAGIMLYPIRSMRSIKKPCEIPNQYQSQCRSAQLTFLRFSCTLYLSTSIGINVTRSGYQSVQTQYFLVICALENLYHKANKKAQATLYSDIKYPSLDARSKYTGLTRLWFAPFKFLGSRILDCPLR